MFVGGAFEGDVSFFQGFFGDFIRLKLHKRLQNLQIGLIRLQQKPLKLIQFSHLLGMLHFLLLTLLSNLIRGQNINKHLTQTSHRLLDHHITVILAEHLQIIQFLKTHLCIRFDLRTDHSNQLQFVINAHQVLVPN